MKELERLAKASFDDYSRRDNKPEGVDDELWNSLGTWENQTEDCRLGWIARARAIISAMTEFDSDNMPGYSDGLWSRRNLDAIVRDFL